MGADNNWSTTTNWDNCGGVHAVPASTDTIIFPAVSPRRISNNNISGLALAQLQILGPNYQITGAAVSLTGGILANASAIAAETTAPTLGLNIALAADAQFVQCAGALDLIYTGNLDLAGFNAIFDAGTCASAAFTDKGMFTAETSKYPPRSDIRRRPEDSPSVDMFREINPFDAVSRATPLAGTPTTVTWAAPQRVDYGNYVLFVEASKTYDFNGTYNTTTFPPPTNIPWAEYGKPWRGQPSVVYRVPFTIAIRSAGLHALPRLTT